MYKQKIVLSTPGTIYISPRSHLFCGSFEDAPQKDCQIIFTDPPWNRTVLNMFYKKAGLPAPDFDQFLGKTIMHLAEKNCPGYLLMGEQSTKQTLNLLNTYGAKVIDVIPWKYVKQPTTYNVIHFNNPAVIAEQNLNTSTGPISVFRKYPCTGQTIYDPFAGVGLFLSAAHSCGFSIVGCEIIPAKFQALQKTIQKLERAYHV